MTTPQAPTTTSDSQSRPRSNFSFYTSLGVPPASEAGKTKFDEDHKFVTSPIFRNPFIFGGLRVLTAVYTLVTLVVMLAIYEVDFGTGSSFFSFFTHLSFIGLCAYFFAASTQTLSYALRWKKNGAGAGFLLQRWPRFLQALHVILYSTVVTYPFIVTIVYWALLSDGAFSTRLRTWTNTSVHILNLFFCISEIVFSNSPPIPWIALPITVLFLGGYLGVAYITRETQGFYPYSFLNPTTTRSGILAAYIIGIAVGQIIIFVLVHWLIRFRQRLALKFRRVLNTASYTSASFSSSANRKSRRARRGTGGGVSSSRVRSSDEEEVLEGRSGGRTAGGREEEDEDWEDVERPSASSKNPAASSSPRRKTRAGGGGGGGHEKVEA